MKPSKKTKPAQSNNQLTLDSLVEAVNMVALRLTALSIQTENRFDELAKAKAPEPKRPTLKWVEQPPQPIRWSIEVDPSTLILTPGTTLRYDAMANKITTYDGVQIGKLENYAYSIIGQELTRDIKLHVYLTTDRRLGIKLGRPQ